MNPSFSLRSTLEAQPDCLMELKLQLSSITCLLLTSLLPSGSLLQCEARSLRKSKLYLHQEMKVSNHLGTQYSSPDPYNYYMATLPPPSSQDYPPFCVNPTPVPAPPSGTPASNLALNPLEFPPGPPMFLPPVVYPPPLAPPPPPPSAAESTKGLWCVAKPAVPDPIIKEAMDYACGSGADCGSIQRNGPCYQPDTVLAHASFAFNSYWQWSKVAGGTCDFGGAAMLVTEDPSYGGCHFITT